MSEPGTPLPWHFAPENHNAYPALLDSSKRKAFEHRVAGFYGVSGEQNARYAWEACNAYPGLVARVATLEAAARKVVDFCMELNIEDSYPTLSGVSELATFLNAEAVDAD